MATKCEKKRLIIIATDGCPDQVPATNGSMMDGKDAFRYVLENERSPTDFVTILACTDDDNVMNYLNRLDKEIPRVDVIDDYHSEMREVRAVQGPQFAFSFGDYVVKGLMGSVDPWFDDLDEKCISGYNPNIQRNLSNTTTNSTTPTYASANYKKDKKGCIVS